MTSSSSSPFRGDALRDRIALITGGASGIGLEISRQLLAHGGRVLLMGRRANVLTEAQSVLGTECGDPSRVAICVGDVRVMAQCEAAVRACVDAFGGLNLLINGAAGNFLSTVNELSVNGFKTVMEIDAIGSFQVRRARKQKA